MSKNKGRKNKTINPRFVEICKYEKNNLKKYLEKELKKYYKNVISNDGFLYVKGEDHVCLTAHMDTTPNVEYGKRKVVKDFYEKTTKDGKHIISSPEGIGGDDRCGVYMILKILETTTLRPSIVFCEDEEIGCVGSEKFSKSKFINDLEDMYFIIELDRRGSKDIVFYDDDNEEFHKFVKEVTNYNIEIGSCSDISNICPECKRSGVNLSCGYYNEHHYYEYVILEEMENTLNTTIKLINEGLKKQKTYEYKEKYYRYNRYPYGIGYDYNEGIYRANYGYRLNEGYTKYYSNLYNNRMDDETLYLEIEFSYKGEIRSEAYEGDNEYEMWYMFFNDYPDVCMNDVYDWNVFTSEEMKGII